MDFVVMLLLIIIGFVIFVLLMDQFLGGKLIRRIICGILFWIPGAASALALSQGCAAIPA